MNKLVVTFLASTAICSGSAWAQSNSGGVDVSSSPDIVVTAQRRSESAKDVPISMTVLSSETLGKSGVVDVVGLAQVTPGLTMQMQNGYVNPSLRGVSTSVVTAGAENPIAVYLDGVYVSNMGASTFSLPDVQQVEVLKGPQGTLFGRNATGGAILITTKKPSMTPTGQIAAYAGLYTGAGSSQSAYDQGVKGFVSGPLVQDTVAASIAFAVRRSNGYGVNPAYGAISSAVDRVYGSDRVDALKDYLLRGKLLIEPNDNISVLFAGYFTETKSDRNQGGYIALDGLALSDAELAFPGRVTATKPWQGTYDALNPGTVVKTRGASVGADFTFPAVGTLTSTTAYAWSRYSENNDSDSSYIPGCLAAFVCTAPFDTIRDKNFQQELLFASEKFGRFSFVAGLNYYRSNARVDVRVNDFTFGSQPLGDAKNPPIFFYDQTVKTRSVGAFAEATYEFTDQLTGIVGLRYSDEKKSGVIGEFGGLDFTTFQPALFLPTNFALTDTKAKKWTPRASLSFAIDSRTNIYATYSQGFKAGIIPGGDPSAPEVKPERITAYEIGLKTIQPSYSLNAAAFYYDYSDLQVSTNGGAGGVVNVVRNAAKARIWGFDVDGSIRLGDSLSLRGGVSWIPYAKYLEYPNAPVTLPRNIDPIDPKRLGVAAGSGIFSNGQNIDLGGSRLFKTPKLTLTASATYVVNTAGGELSLTPNVYYASKLYTDPTHLSFLSTDEFKLGGEISFKPADRPFGISVWGKNLTNNSAFISTAATGSATVLIPGDPQEIGATLTFDF